MGGIMSLQLQSAVGLLAIPFLAWLMSERRADLAAAPTRRLVITGIVLQLVIAGAMLNVEVLRAALAWPAALVNTLQSVTNQGMRLVFGYLAGAPAPFEVTEPGNGFVLAFQALPIVLLISVLSRVLYHWGILQRVVHAVAWALRKTLGVGGPVGTSAAANIFVGMVEAPLLIRPYVSQLSRGGLFAVMTVGMATIAGTVLAIYASLLEPTLNDAAGHLVVASVISAPAALMLAALMVPDDATDVVQSPGPADGDEPSTSSAMDAVAQGTRDGLTLLASVVAMLVVMIALIALINEILGLVAEPLGMTLTLERIVGWGFAPLALLVGIPLSECVQAGQLLGIKTIANELVAFIELSATGADALSDRSRLILTYALCGFANFGSLGIMIGGLVSIAPGRRADIASLGVKSIIAGTLATMMTGAVVGVLTPG
jgi:CNT family concentrative nucleoside transporter